MKRGLFLAIATTALSSAAAQTTTVMTFGSDGASARPTAPAEQRRIGRAALEATYDYVYEADTLRRGERTMRDVMILQTGGEVSKFYSYNSFRVDSLVSGAVSVEAALANIGNFKGGESWTVYKNYPAGKMSTTDRIGRDWFLVEEPLEPQAWCISDETREIAGYSCVKAECDFRGRRWTAWFAPEIPLGEGPWKLSGLPGLILAASDGTGDNSFTLSGLRATDSPIAWPKEQYVRASLREYLKAARQFVENPLAMFARSGMTVRVTTPDGKEFEPENKPMTRDFLER